jgi:hypothetical protein
MKSTKQGRGGTRKYGKNSVKCARYRAEGRREKNKKRKAEKRARKLAHAKARREARQNRGQ